MMGMTTIAALLCAITAVQAFLTSPASMCCRVNQERAKYGLAPLGVLPQLNDAAQSSAQMQSQAGMVLHVSADGSSTPMSRITAAGVNDWQSVGENAAGRFDSEAWVMDAWIASPDHHETMLGSYNCMGSATVNGFWTQEFALVPGACSRPRCKYNNGARRRSRIEGRMDAEDAVAKVKDAMDGIHGIHAARPGNITTFTYWKSKVEVALQEANSQEL